MFGWNLGLNLGLKLGLELEPTLRGAGSNIAMPRIPCGADSFNLTYRDAPWNELKITQRKERL